MHRVKLPARTWELLVDARAGSSVAPAHFAVKSELTGFRGDAPGFAGEPLNMVFEP